MAEPERLKGSIPSLFPPRTSVLGHAWWISSIHHIETSSDRLLVRHHLGVKLCLTISIESKTHVAMSMH